MKILFVKLFQMYRRWKCRMNKTRIHDIFTTWKWLRIKMKMAYTEQRRSSIECNHKTIQDWVKQVECTLNRSHRIELNQKRILKTEEKRYLDDNDVLLMRKLVHVSQGRGEFKSFFEYFRSFKNPGEYFKIF